MNILCVSFDYPPLSGGIAKVSYETAKHLSMKGDTLIVVAPRVKGYKEFDSAANLITFRITNIKVIRELELFFVMLYLIIKFNIEIIYNFVWYPSGQVSYIISILTGIPYVIHVYAMDYFEDRRSIINRIKYNPLWMFIKKRVFDRARKIIAISNFTRDRLIARGIDALKVVAVAMGVDCGCFMPGLNASEIILKHRLENKRVLLTVSRLDDYKGHDTVIKILPRLVSKFPDIAYLIVGAGPHERHLRKLVDRLNVNEYVIFTGRIDDSLLPLYYNACDVFVMLSREIYNEAKAEGYGLVFLEAGACGRPVVGGRSGGIEDAVIDGVTGILVDPLNLDEIEDAVAKVLSDRHYASALGRNALDRIRKENLNWHSGAMRIREILIHAK